MNPVQRSFAGSGLLAGLILCACADYVISTQFDWPGVVYIFEDRAGYQGASLVVLLTLALAMYVAAARVLGLVVAGSVAVIQQKVFDERAPERLLDFLSEALTSDRALERHADLLEEPVRRWHRLIDLARGALRARPADGLVEGLLRSNPRDLLDHERSADLAKRIVWSAHGGVSDIVWRLEIWSERAATLGLAGTVLGLFVAGKNLADADTLSLGLRAGLLKALIGYGAKFIAQYFAGRYTARVRARERKLVEAVDQAWLASNTRAADARAGAR